MRIITARNIHNAALGSEDEDFLAIEAISGSPSELAKSTLRSDTLTLSLGECDTIAIINCNAESIDSVTITGEAAMEWEDTEIDWEETEIAWYPEETMPTVTTVTDAPNSVIKLRYSAAVDMYHVVEITMTAPVGEVLKIGEVVAGPTLQLAGPAYGFTRRPVDMSVTVPYQAGGNYYRFRHILDAYDAQTVWDNDTEADPFYAFIKGFGQQSTFWELSETDGQYDLFGHWEGESEDVKSYLNHSDNSFSVIEDK